MKAIVKDREIIPENKWTPWIQCNLDYLIGKETDTNGEPMKGDGWTLVENYTPEQEDTE